MSDDITARLEAATQQAEDTAAKAQIWSEGDENATYEQTSGNTVSSIAKRNNDLVQQFLGASLLTTSDDERVELKSSLSTGTNPGPDAMLASVFGDTALNNGRYYKESGSSTWVLILDWLNERVYGITQTDTLITFINTVGISKFVEGNIFQTSYKDSNQVEGSGWHNWVLKEDASLSDNGGTILNVTGDWYLVAVGLLYTTPELFGAVGNGINDDTVSFQNFINNLNANDINRKCGKALKKYRITDTINFTILKRVELQIGLSSVDNLNSETDTPDTGIVYDGPAGLGPEPENCKPIIWFKDVNDCTFPVISVRQNRNYLGTDPNGDPEKYVTGLLFSNGDSIQRGNSYFGIINVGNCERGMVVGLSANTGGLIGHTGSYTDDVFESCIVQDLKFTGCRHDYYQSSNTGDHISIKHAQFGGYHPYNSDFSFDFGPTHQAVYVRNGGNIKFDELQIANKAFATGEAEDIITVSSVSGNTFTATAHGLVSTDQVSVFNLGGARPSGPTYTDTMYPVNITANTFDLSYTEGGTAITLTDTGSGVTTIGKRASDVSFITVDGAYIHIDKCSCEGNGAIAFDKTNAAQGRHSTSVNNLFTSYGCCGWNNLAVRTIGGGKYEGLNLGGHFAFAENPVSVKNVIFQESEGRPRNFKDADDYSDMLDATGRLTGSSIIDVKYQNDTTNSPELQREGFRSFMPNLQTSHLDGYPFWMNEYKQQSAVNVDFVDGDVNTTTDVITVVGHGLLEDTTVTLVSTGTLPAGLSEGVRYVVINRTSTTFELSEDGVSAIDITAAAGGGTHTVHRVFDVCYLEQGTGTQASGQFNFVVNLRDSAGTNDCIAATKSYDFAFTTDKASGYAIGGFITPGTSSALTGAYTSAEIYACAGVVSSDLTGKNNRMILSVGHSNNLSDAAYMNVRGNFSHAVNNNTDRSVQLGITNNDQNSSSFYMLYQ